MCTMTAFPRQQFYTHFIASQLSSNFNMGQKKTGSFMGKKEKMKAKNESWCRPKLDGQKQCVGSGRIPTRTLPSPATTRCIQGENKGAKASVFYTQKSVPCLTGGTVLWPYFDCLWKKPFLAFDKILKNMAKSNLKKKSNIRVSGYYSSEPR